jgi:hypothetical protein
LFCVLLLLSLREILDGGSQRLVRKHMFSHSPKNRRLRPPGSIVAQYSPRFGVAFGRFDCFA